jgi:hypothetical protein
MLGRDDTNLTQFKFHVSRQMKRQHTRHLSSCLFWCSAGFASVFVEAC